MCTSLRAQDNTSIDGYFLINGHPFYFFAEGIRDHAEYRINSSDNVEIVLTSPVDEKVDWNIVQNGACDRYYVLNNGSRVLLYLRGSGDIVLEATTPTSRLLVTLYCN